MGLRESLGIGICCEVKKIYSYTDGRYLTEPETEDLLEGPVSKKSSQWEYYAIDVIYKDLSIGVLDYYSEAPGKTFLYRGKIYKVKK